MKRDIEKAIEYIEYARETHVDWAKWIKERPQEAEKLMPAKEVGGDIEHPKRAGMTMRPGLCISQNEEWVRQYDHVLKVLSAVKNRLGSGDVP